MLCSVSGFRTICHIHTLKNKRNNKHKDKHKTVLSDIINGYNVFAFVFCSRRNWWIQRQICWIDNLFVFTFAFAFIFVLCLQFVLVLYLSFKKESKCGVQWLIYWIWQCGGGDRHPPPIAHVLGSTIWVHMLVIMMVMMMMISTMMIVIVTDIPLPLPSLQMITVLHRGGLANDYLWLLH